MQRKANRKTQVTATLGFEGKLWNAAELMRGKQPATQYRQVLMGLLFLRYVSDAFEKRYQELKKQGYGEEEDRDAYMEENIFFVPKSARWAKIAAVAHDASNGACQTPKKTTWGNLTMTAQAINARLEIATDGLQE